MKSSSAKILTLKTILIATLASLSWATVALPCNTPVNRYALYKWHASPYYIFHLRKGGDDSKGKPIQEGLKKFFTSDDHEAQGEKAEGKKVTNFSYVAIDIDNQEEFTQLPPKIRHSLQSVDESKYPFYLVVNPRGREVYRGDLEVKDLALMADSPARQKMAKHLHDGCDGVLFFLPNEDKEASKKASEEVDKVIKLVAPKEEGKKEEKKATSLDELIQGTDELSDSPLNVTRITLDRKDPAEKWFIRFLYACEDMEEEDLKEPMVYAAYGRGRIMEPYLGGGIIADNLLMVIRFINGPCSCQVKDENPGVDLLTTWDWHTSAVKIAKQIGEETGNEHLLGEKLVWDVTELGKTIEDEGEKKDPKNEEDPTVPTKRVDLNSEEVKTQARENGTTQLVTTDDPKVKKVEDDPITKVESPEAEKKTQAEEISSAPPSNSTSKAVMRADIREKPEKLDDNKNLTPKDSEANNSVPINSEDEGGSVSSLPLLVILICIAGGFLGVASFVLVLGKK